MRLKSNFKQISSKKVGHFVRSERVDSEPRLRSDLQTKQISAFADAKDKMPEARDARSDCRIFA